MWRLFVLVLVVPTMVLAEGGWRVVSVRPTSPDETEMLGPTGSIQPTRSSSQSTALAFEADDRGRNSQFLLLLGVDLANHEQPYLGLGIDQTSDPTAELSSQRALRLSIGTRANLGPNSITYIEYGLAMPLADAEEGNFNPVHSLKTGWRW